MIFAARAIRYLAAGSVEYTLLLIFALLHAAMGIAIIIFSARHKE